MCVPPVRIISWGSATSLPPVRVNFEKNANLPTPTNRPSIATAFGRARAPTCTSNSQQHWETLLPTPARHIQIESESFNYFDKSVVATIASMSLGARLEVWHRADWVWNWMMVIVEHGPGHLFHLISCAIGQDQVRCQSAAKMVSAKATPK